MINHSKPTIESSDILAVQNILRSSQISSGNINNKFCDELKKFFNAKNVILTSSGTSAIVEALRILKVKSTDEIIIPAYVCSSVAHAIILSGAKPKVVDINSDDYNISYEDTVKNINKHTKAIIIPYMFGNALDNIEKFKSLGITIIEDVAQSIGGKYRRKRLGSFGDMTVCSFYATKMITTGEGGALVIRNPKLINQFNRDAYLYHMPDFQAALGISQLKKVDNFIFRRQKLANQYIKGLKNVSGCFVSKPKESIYYRFIVEADKSELYHFMAQMRKQGIIVSRFTDLVFNYLKLSAKSYPNTKKALDRVASLPLYPSLTKKEINSIINISKKVFLLTK